MCWVMPPLSDWTTFDLRIRSSSEVFPWSTWPRMVITGGREHQVLRRAGRGEGLEQIILGRALVNDLELDAELQGQHDRQFIVEKGVDGGELIHRHQLVDQVSGLDADRLGESADGDRRFDFRVGLPGGRQRGPLAGSVLLAAGTGPSHLVVNFEQGGGGDGRGHDAALAGALAPPGAAAGAVGGRAQPAGLLPFFLIVDRGGGRGAGAGMPGPGGRRMAGPPGGGGPAPWRAGPGLGPEPRRSWPGRGPWPAARPGGRRPEESASREPGRNAGRP